jgi:hypothetical protein
MKEEANVRLSQAVGAGDLLVGEIAPDTRFMEPADDRCGLVGCETETEAALNQVSEERRYAAPQFKASTQPVTLIRSFPDRVVGAAGSVRISAGQAPNDGGIGIGREGVHRPLPCRPPTVVTYSKSFGSQCLSDVLVNE